MDGETWKVAGSPELRAGETYLLCLRRRPAGTWSPVLLAYGVLREAAGRNGTPILEPVEESFQAGAS